MIHVAMHAVMAEEEKAFTLGDILQAVSEKLIRRHPHVFGSAKAGSAREVKANWERLKMQEGRSSVLDGVPRKLPALLKARRLQEKASKVGFDWNDRNEVWKKVEEEIRELRDAESQDNQSKKEEEFGDLLFSLVNYSRFLEIHPELALSRTSDKFSRRFRKIEKELARRNIKPAEAGLDLMDQLWTEGKESAG
jgi:XTP/dITP diphosphohydrolase